MNDPQLSPGSRSAESPRRKRTRRRNKKTRGKPSHQQYTSWPTEPAGLLVARFMSCSACGYLLTGYRAAFGVEQVARMANESHDNWLDFGWHPRLRALLLQAYSIDVDGAYKNFEHCCEVCQRVLTVVRIEAGLVAEQDLDLDEADRTIRFLPVNLRVQLMPQPMASSDE